MSSPIGRSASKKIFIAARLPVAAPVRYPKACLEGPSLHTTAEPHGRTLDERRCAVPDTYRTFYETLL